MVKINLDHMLMLYFGCHLIRRKESMRGESTIVFGCCLPITQNLLQEVLWSRLGVGGFLTHVDYRLSYVHFWPNGKNKASLLHKEKWSHRVCKEPHLLQQFRLIYDVEEWQGITYQSTSSWTIDLLSKTTRQLSLVKNQWNPRGDCEAETSFSQIPQYLSLPLIIHVTFGAEHVGVMRRRMAPASLFYLATRSIMISHLSLSTLDDGFCDVGAFTRTDPKASWRQAN